MISAFEYASGINQRMYRRQRHQGVRRHHQRRRSLVKSGQTHGNYVASQLANAGRRLDARGQRRRRPAAAFNGTTWATLATTTPADWATARLRDQCRAMDTLTARWKCRRAYQPGTARSRLPRRHSDVWILTRRRTASLDHRPAGSPVENGSNLTYVCKYRNR